MGSGHLAHPRHGGVVRGPEFAHRWSMLSLDPFVRSASTITGVGRDALVAQFPAALQRRRSLHPSRSGRRLDRNERDALHLVGAACLKRPVGDEAVVVDPQPPDLEDNGLEVGSCGSTTTASSPTGRLRHAAPTRWRASRSLRSSRLPERERCRELGYQRVPPNSGDRGCTPNEGVEAEHRPTMRELMARAQHHHGLGARDDRSPRRARHNGCGADLYGGQRSPATFPPGGFWAQSGDHGKVRRVTVHWRLRFLPQGCGAERAWPLLGGMKLPRQPPPW